MDLSMLNTNYVWTPDWTAEDRDTPRIVRFRKEAFLEAVPEQLWVKISADSRYKLYVNGHFVTEGPQKGNLEVWYADSVDIAPWLLRGANIVAAEVLRYPESFSRRNMSLYRTPFPCLYLEQRDGTDFIAKSGFRCKVDRMLTFRKEPWNPAPIYAMEMVSGSNKWQGWKEAGYDDSDWAEAVPYSIMDIPQGQSPFNLRDRSIPPMAHHNKRFAGVVCLRDDQDNEIDDAARTQAWNALLQAGKALAIPAHTTETVEISADTLRTAYPLLSVSGGKGSSVRLLCSECYAGPPVPNGGTTPDNLPVKGDRIDHMNGRLHGNEDSYTAGGFGTKERPEAWEPFWLRTFRFLRVTVETGDAPLTIQNLSYRTVGYPLESATNIRCSDDSFAPIWDISLRTLKRCMLETYVDCPFYEQLQYAQDARAEALFTYTVSADDRLARQCMEAFRLSQRSDGLINSCAPTVRTNVIVGFSIYYLLMIHDHMMYFGDRDLVQTHLPAIEQILAFFDRNRLDCGVVGHVGGTIVRERYWSFIDWCAQWNLTGGCPPASRKGTGAITMESLLYLIGLQKAAELEDFAGDPARAKIYRAQAAALGPAIRENCIGQGLDGVPLLQDGPGIEEYSAHQQVFAILTGVVSPEEGRAMLNTVLAHPELPQCSVSMHPYLFRALELTGQYEKADDRWNIWRKMVADHLSTCVENDADARSDCHAWGSAILYELPAAYLGLRPAAPGFARASIRPVTGHLTWCEGDVITPRGMARIAWRKNGDGHCELQYKLPEGDILDE